MPGSDRQLGSRIVIAASFTADEVRGSLAFWFQQIGLSITVDMAPHGQVFQQLLDPQSLLRSNPGANIVLLRLEDFTSQQAPAIERRDRLPAVAADLAAAIETARASSPLIVAFCPPGAAMRDLGLAEVEQAIAGRLAATAGVHVIRSGALIEAQRGEPYLDAQADALGHVPYTPLLFATLGTALARKVHAVGTPPPKVIALDCDNTLWSGICGEDGPLGVSIDPPYRALQQFFAEQQRAGLLLCLCSRNNEQDVDAVFAAHPEMPLRRDQFVAARIDWEPKSANLRSLAAQLDLGLDSFVFVDDDPVVCAEVRASCPEVLTLCLPAEAAAIPGFLAAVWPLDRRPATGEDIRRTELYRANAEREQLRERSATLADFLASLELEVSIEPAAPRHAARIAQLTARTNQFNSTTLRLTEPEIAERIAANGLLAVTVSDRFGDYGLVGAVLLGDDGGDLAVTGLMLSCRVLGRGVEHRVLAHLGELAIARGLGDVVIDFADSGRNRAVREFLDAVADPRDLERPGYRIAATAAAATRHEPTTASRSASREPARATVPAVAPASWERIATELATSSRVLEAIERARRRSRDDVIGPAEHYVAPSGPIETWLAQLWCDALGVDRIGVTDDVFRLGADSLRMMRVLARVMERHEVQLSLVYQTPTIAAMARAIEQTSQPAPVHAEPPPPVPEVRIQPVESTTARAVPEAASVRSLAIFTCDRPSGLARAATTFAGNIARHGRDIELIVMGDSRQPGGPAMARKQLVPVASRLGVRVSHASVGDRRRFADQLIQRSGVAPDVVRFCLLGELGDRRWVTVGANHNSLLLETAGDMVVSVDDDTACRAITAGGPARPRLAVSHDPGSIWFLDQVADAGRIGKWIDVDVLAGHDAVLGSRPVLAELERVDSVAPWPNQTDTPLVDRVASGQAWVAVSFNGVVGDCGWGAPFGYWGMPMGSLILDGDSHDRRARTAELYAASTRTRTILRVVPAVSISDAPTIGAFKGLDNRKLLPPFVPIQRGQDVVFDRVVWRCFERACFAHLPVALTHAPESRRPFSPGEIARTASSYDTARLIMDAVLSCPLVPGDGDPATRMRQLGEHLIELGKLPEAAFEQRLRDQATATAGRVLDWLEAHVQARGGAPACWADDVRRFARSLRDGLDRPDYCTPLDLVTTGSLAEARTLGRRLVRSFGELLVHWPVLVEAARQLRAEGHRLAVPIDPPRPPRRQAPPASAPVPPALQPLGRGGDLSCSFAQERMWFLHQLDPDTPAYHVSNAVRLRGRLDRDALQLALQAVIDRHEPLRTVYDAADGTPCQRILPAAPVALAVEDVSRLSPDAIEARLIAETGRPFDLGTGPVVRAGLFRVGEDDHILHITIHHIATDGWSIGVLWTELRAHYTAVVQGVEPALPALAVQYADYAAWQKAWLSGGELERQLDYWRHRLAGAPAEIALPTKGPRPQFPDHRGDWVAVTLGADLVRRIRHVGRQQRATLFMTLLAGLRALLARTSGDDDLCIGVPIANRPRSELAGLIGMFVNTVALRLRVAPERSFADLLAEERTGALEAYANQHVPFEAVVDTLEIERTLGRTPLFQVMFNDEVMRAGERGLALPGLRDEPVALPPTARFDIAVTCAERGADIEVRFVYRTDLFDRALIEQLVQQYVRLLDAVATDPARPLASIRLLDEAERRRILVDWNRTDRALDSPCSVHRIVETSVDRRPDAIAVVREGETLTYRELDDRANQLAHHLIARGARPDQPVGLLVERSVDALVAILGILKAGAAFMPLDPNAPPARLVMQIADAGARLVVGHSRWRSLIEGSDAAPVWLDREQALVARAPTKRPQVTVDADNLAYVLFTSGSTGRPMGVLCTHGSLRNRLAWVHDAAELAPGDVLLHKTPLVFDLSIWEIVAALDAGARLVVADPRRHGDPAYISELIRRERVTTLHFVPSMLQVFLDSTTDPLPSLRRVFCGGEALSPMLAERFLSRFSAELINRYGPTEATINVTIWRCQRDEPGRAVPIGRPIANCRMYVLDPDLEPVPPGVAGELYIAGMPLARGYVRRPGLTAERFLPDPYGPPGSRLYRTGDRARIRHDGEIEFIGRLDQQIKLRGFRIELGEVESALLGHPSVIRAAVALRADRRGDPRLVAYVVGDGHAIDPAALRAHLARTLPSYMIPALFVDRDELPFTVSGKLDRKALLAPPDDPAVASEGDGVPPSTPMEEVLAAIWSDVLGVPQLGIHDDFFALGGHSLLAVTLTDRIRRQLDRSLELRAVFENPTIERMARALEAGGEQGSPLAITPVTPDPARTVGPGSPIQQRFFRVAESYPGARLLPPFRATLDLTVTGELDPDLIAASLAACVRRHAGLRTALRIEGERIIQTVLDPSPAGALERPDLEHLRDVCVQPLDIAGGQMFRAGLAELDDRSHRFVLSVDHLACDGRGIGILLRDLFAIYTALRADPATRPDHVLPRLTHRYLDWSEHQWRLLAGDYGLALERYWKQRLAGAPELALPIDRVTATEVGPGLIRIDRAGAEFLSLLDAFTHANHTTRPIALLSLLFASLHRLTGQTDLCAVLPADARGDEFSDVVGHFVIPLIIRAQIEPGMSFAALCRQVRASVLEAYEWRRVPLYAVTQPPRGLWRIALNYRRRPTFPCVAGLDIRPTAEPYRTGMLTDMDLQVHVIEAAGRDELGISGLARADKLDPETVDRLLRGFLAAQDLLAAPDDPITPGRR